MTAACRLCGSLRQVNPKDATEKKSGGGAVQTVQTTSTEHRETARLVISDRLESTKILAHFDRLYAPPPPLNIYIKIYICWGTGAAGEGGWEGGLPPTSAFDVCAYESGSFATLCMLEQTLTRGITPF